jgi:acyl-CoA thioester hydrolase
MTTLQPVTRRVEHVDTDAAGVVHFTRYASLIESAVLENLDRLGLGITRWEQGDLTLALRGLRMRYTAPGRFLDRLRTDVTVTRVSGAICEWTGEVHRETGQPAPGVLLASGVFEFCVVRGADGAPVALPDDLRHTLRAFLNGDRNE